MDKKRILIIDDESGFTRMVKINLEKTGEFDVREENRAPNALFAAREFKPDLILLDVVMPAMDGGDVYAMFQKDRRLRKVPTVFLTAAVSNREAGVHGLTSGGALFLAKPVSVENLINFIHEHLPKNEPAPAAAQAVASAPLSSGTSDQPGSATAIPPDTTPPSPAADAPSPQANQPGPSDQSQA